MDRRVHQPAPSYQATVIGPIASIWHDRAQRSTAAAQNSHNHLVVGRADGRPAFTFDPGPLARGFTVHLLRYAVLHGTGIQADLPGFADGGKTGTSEPLLRGVYVQGQRQTWFFCACPLNGMPRYSMLVMLDAPQNVPVPSSPATAEWNAAPAARHVIMRIAPFLDLGNWVQDNIM